ncbi:TetR/AcrR family transcriptional regulator [Clostridium beijerinckii]|uniref:AcrR family transcriptional regulator n=1 Tax=Clostridium beijerinckii TaxID=1520 RepID=A0AAX0B1C3_CLOBE|nr:TetR/AcrR family transcriptional regulator [Clostridium beijerinckii]MBA8935341.1 AcrR family transcriptional regulator [Clostridium beijerinckii]NRT34488.1 AcrR family transcriptional regulator [Clostridium beijerinckii]NRT46081.1 AcrR family transcriptional regulator [Clostridium beijerinckii]NRT88163.1 AcrR family transcriptional regulator [Clostridium beijerinckii]NRU39736.1 AcrR family transcriptional regulator [Clostridium beijerinckii]
MNQIKNNSSRYECEISKLKFIQKLVYPIKRNGIKALRSDDIAKYMGLSKATLYKYFSSKDEIIKELVEYYIGELLEVTIDNVDDAFSYVKEWQETFKNSLLSANFISDSFKNDLKESYPELFEMVKKASQKYNAKLIAFYKKGIDFGVFNDLNPAIVILQDEAFFKDMLNPLYLMDNNLTIRTTINDYYKCKKIQVIKNEHQKLGDDKWEELSEYLVQKVSSSIM